MGYEDQIIVMTSLAKAFRKGRFSKKNDSRWERIQGGHAGRNEKKRNGECIESQEGGLRTTAFLKVAQKILLK
jgi:hypothetical protein